MHRRIEREQMNTLLRIACVIAWLQSTIVASAQNSQPPQELGQIVNQAYGLIGQGDFAGAETLARSATEKFAERPMSWTLLGHVRQAQKQFDKAMSAYEKANQLAGGSAPNVLYNMACLEAVQGNKDKAFQLLESATKAGFSNLAHLQSDPDLDSLREDPRYQKYGVAAELTEDQLFLEPTRIIHQWNGEAAGDQFGWTARKVGDIDGDHVIDFVTTAPTFNRSAGKVYVYSSRSGELIHAVTGGPGFRLGNSAVGLGDVNGDDIPDFIAGAPGAAGKGAAIVYSGKDASVIHRVNGETPGGQFGYEVSEVGDFDGDGVPDFFVGEMAGNGQAVKSGRGVVYSGRTAERLIELPGEESGDCFGNAAAAAQVGENEFLLAIGAQNAGEGDRGRVYVYSIKQAQANLKFTIDSDRNGVNLGQMFIAFPGDLDRDGTPDVYASDFSDNTRSAGGGKIVVHSGADGSQLLVLYGAQSGEGLGTSPSDAGDVDGDGVGDLVIGAWQNRDGAQSGGRVYLYSAAGAGRLLRSWTCRQAGDTLGFDACGIGDVDGDGSIDFLLTSAWSNVGGRRTGRVFIVAGEDYSGRKDEPLGALDLRAGNVSTLLDDIAAGTGGLNIDSQGRLYTADFGWRLDGQGKGGNLLHRVTMDGKSELFCDKLRGGSGNTFDADGNLFQSCIGGNFISKITPEGEFSVFCREGIRNPVGLAFGSDGDLFVCNCGDHTIRRVTPEGKSTVFCDSGLLKCPNGIATGPDGMLYVCNFGNGDVIQIDPRGQATKLATLPGNNNGHLIYHRGFLYVLARKDCRVYRVDLAGRVQVFAGSGLRGKDDGPPLESKFSLPNSLVISPAGDQMFLNETSPIEGDHRILGPTRIRCIELKKAGN